MMTFWLLFGLGVAVADNDAAPGDKYRWWQWPLVIMAWPAPLGCMVTKLLCAMLKERGIEL